MHCGLGEIHAVIGLLITGAASAILRKVLFQMEAPGVGGVVHPFAKPWFTTTQSATASTLCLLFYYITKLWHILQGRAARKKLLTKAESRAVVRTLTHTGSLKVSNSVDSGIMDEAAKEFVKQTAPYHHAMERKAWLQLQYGHMSWVKFGRLVLPAITGQLALIFQGIGLKYTSASINQMVSGSCIIFTAFMAVTILKRKLNWMHKSGISLALVGVAVVSVATSLDTGGSSGLGLHQLQPTTAQVIFGIIITLVSQFIQAVQFVFEELFLSDLMLHPNQVLGYEGIISILAHVFVFLPGVYFLPGTDAGGRQENSIDTYLMLKNSKALLYTDIAYFWMVVGTLAYGLMVSSKLGSVFRAVLLTTRTALVWGVDLALFYSGIAGGLGEAWSRMSWVEVTGFALLLYGTVQYAQGATAVVDEGVDVVESLDPTYMPPEPILPAKDSKPPGEDSSPVNSFPLALSEGPTTPGSMRYDDISSLIPDDDDEDDEVDTDRPPTPRGLLHALSAPSAWILPPQDVETIAPLYGSSFRDGLLLGLPYARKKSTADPPERSSYIPTASALGPDTNDTQQLLLDDTNEEQP